MMIYVFMYVACNFISISSSTGDLSASKIRIRLVLAFRMSFCVEMVTYGEKIPGMICLSHTSFFSRNSP